MVVSSQDNDWKRRKQFYPRKSPILNISFEMRNEIRIGGSEEDFGLRHRFESHWCIELIEAMEAVKIVQGERVKSKHC